jgi:phage anti-repressor protein
MDTQIKHFIEFLRKQKCIIPETFIVNYYILTKTNLISLSDCVLWINVSRDSVVKTLKNTYVENKDYFFIDKNEELNLSIISKKTFDVVSNNKKYIKLTIDCFKKLSMSSNSKNGRLTKQYYIEMERIVKDFSNQELQQLRNENAKLKRNLNPIIISEKEGLYTWHENNILKYRIGSGEILRRRIKQHNSSHADNIIVDYCLETMYYKDLESIVLKILETKRYRENKDFFDCDIKIIKKAIIKANKLLLEFRDNCDENKISNIVKTKKLVKKTSKK